MSILAEKRVLIVEDELIVAMVLEDMLNDLGARDTRSASSVVDALTLIREDKFDLGILDINLGGQRSTEVADLLRTLSVPIIYATGYDDGAEPDAVVLQKPYTQSDVAQAIEMALK